MSEDYTVFDPNTECDVCMEFNFEDGTPLPCTGCIVQKMKQKESQ